MLKKFFVSKMYNGGPLLINFQKVPKFSNIVLQDLNRITKEAET